MKACSFLAATSQMIYDMDLEKFIHGVTFALIHPDHSSIPPHLTEKFKRYLGTTVHEII